MVSGPEPEKSTEIWHQPSDNVIGKVFGVGYCEMTLDDRGRVGIPKNLRYGINSRLVGTAWFDHCLVVCNISNWDEVLADLLQRETLDISPRDVERLFVERSFTSGVDKTKRIVIPSKFREYAGITSRTMVLGLGDRLEIWDINRWQEYRGTLKEQGKEIMPTLPEFPLGS